MSEQRKITIVSSVILLIIKVTYGIHVGCFVGAAAGACIGMVEGGFSYLMSFSESTEYGSAIPLLSDTIFTFVGGSFLSPANTITGFFGGMFSGAGVGAWGVF
ncbi:hypothetical protein [Oscillatoria salina]|uniref:hypothetical protein n=1 Tax=Oscillatoria salina TaxID=331517 RepID=UPI001CCC28D4|nr:hypothetical protein [Oscillatoria salina]MBZ8179635.1 hypothetical protein [Oscillatoria salina IIICB1]